MDVQPRAPNEIRIAASDTLYRREIARSLGIHPNNINLLTTDAFETGQSRFLFGFTDTSPPSDYPPSFVKLAKEPSHKEQLQREVKSMELAKKMGIPTIHVHNGYFESPLGYGIIRLKKIDIEEGLLLANDELIAAAPKDKHFGSRAALLIAASIGKRIQPNIDTSFLLRGQKRLGSEQTFWELWDEENQTVLSSRYDAYRNQLIPRDELLSILIKSRVDLESLVIQGYSDDEYFVHNDTSPSNCFFTNGSEVGNQDILLDFEQAAATHNIVLGAITDISDFYNRAWANPEMQQEFLCTLLQELKQFPLTDRYKIIRGAAVFGTMFASQFYMDDNHPRNIKAKYLLQHLQSNLADFDSFWALQS